MSEASRFERILNKYNYIIFFGETSRKHLELFASRRETMNIISFDKPDIIISNNKFIYFLEHFEFDSSLNTKKGTEMKNEEAKVSREFNRYVEEKLKDTKSDELIIKRDTYKTNRSIEHYIANFTRNFNRHYLKIDTYKKMLK